MALRSRWFFCLALFSLACGGRSDPKKGSLGTGGMAAGGFPGDPWGTGGTVTTWPPEGGDIEDTGGAQTTGGTTSWLGGTGGLVTTGGTLAGSGGGGGTKGSSGASSGTRSTGPRSCVNDATRDVACPGSDACLNDINPAYVLVHDRLDGSSLGKIVGTPHPEFSPGVVGSGMHPLRTSEGAMVRYPITPQASGTLSFWVKVIAPLDFYRGTNIGILGHELGDCNDFYMQIQSDGLNVAIQSSTGGTRFRDVIASVLSWKSCETHHLVLTWGSNEKPELYIDGVWKTLSGAAGPYLVACDSTASSLFFGATRELYQTVYSPGALVYDELLLLSRSLSKIEKGLMAVDDACPCPGPSVGETWTNHQAYVDCVSQTAKGLVAALRIDSTQSDGIVTQASQSACGSRD